MKLPAMRSFSSLALKNLGLCTSFGISSWMRTLDFRVRYADPWVDPALYPVATDNRIYVFWHEYLLAPLYARGNCNLAMLLSQHADAEIISNIASIFGFECVRGSTNRGGAKALRELMSKAGEQTHLTITPDGPRGPRRQFTAGAVFLAAHLQIPIVAFGIGYNNPWRFNRAWDKFAVPKLGSRVRFIVSQEIHVPKRLGGREGLENWRKKLEDILNGLTADAEDWAESGKVYSDELPVPSGRYSVENVLAVDQATSEKKPEKLIR